MAGAAWGCATNLPLKGDVASDVRKAPGSQESLNTVSPSVRSAGPPPEVLDVETSTDAEFVMNLPLEDGEPEPSGQLGMDPVWTETGTTASFDIPMTETEAVQFWRDYLAGRGSRVFRKWLGRSTRFVPLFHQILEEYGLPKDLVFLAMVESGFSTSAYSWAHAAGPWQFVASTARHYGLRIDFWVDERRDFERATDAAARHLSDLYQRYGDWYLAFAAYNAGVGKVNRAIRRYRTEDFWALSERRYLRRETKQYVPKILAAAQLAKSPTHHGLTEVSYQPPLAWTTVTVTTATSLKAFAAACPDEVQLEDMKALNPALRARVTPPEERWPVRVPSSVTATCSDALRAAPAAEGFVYRYHQVEPSDRLESVAQLHRTTAQEILAFNGIEPDQFSDFDEMVIPVPRRWAHRVPVIVPPRLPFRSPVYGPQQVRLVRYRVRAGDSLWKIAQRFRVSIAELLRWNGLRRDTVLAVGRPMRIYLGSDAAVRRAQQRLAGRGLASKGRSSPAPSRSRMARPGRPPEDSGRRHRVQPGESYWLVAHRTRTSVADLLALNGKELQDVLQPGDILRVPKSTAPLKASERKPGPVPPGMHRVRPGESLWLIGREHGLSVDALRRLNRKTLRSGKIRPGQLLRVRESTGPEP